MWRRYVDDELWNRDHPGARARTQRKPPAAEREEESGAAGRRPRLPPALEDDGGLDKAYLREYIDPEAKRQRRE